MGTPRAVYCWKLGGCREENDQSVQRTPVLFSSPPSSALGINRGGSGQATELNGLSGLILNGISCSYLNSLTSSLNSGAASPFYKYTRSNFLFLLHWSFCTCSDAVPTCSAVLFPPFLFTSRPVCHVISRLGLQWCYTGLFSPISIAFSLCVV